ncbi:MAG: hypothetical protein AAGA09_09035 [Pseudomonadota bacterium]
MIALCSIVCRSWLSAFVGAFWFGLYFVWPEVLSGLGIFGVFYFIIKLLSRRQENSVKKIKTKILLSFYLNNWNKSFANGGNSVRRKTTGIGSIIA